MYALKDPDGDSNAADTAQKSPGSFFDGSMPTRRTVAEMMMFILTFLIRGAEKSVLVTNLAKAHASSCHVCMLKLLAAVMAAAEQPTLQTEGGPGFGDGTCVIDDDFKV